MKAPRFYHEKPFPTGTLGDLIRAQRREAGLSRKQLSIATGIPLYWLGRWELDRAFPNAVEWANLNKILRLPIRPDI